MANEDKKLNPDESMFRMAENEAAAADLEKEFSSNSKTFENEEENITPPQFQDDETESMDGNNNNAINFENNDNYDFNMAQQLSNWEEEDDDNGVVKKYIVYVSKDYVPYIDELTLDERSAYINDALEMKINAQTKAKEIKNKKRLMLHIFLAIIVILITTPIAILGVHKAIMATFDNYKYSQDNFEKLYRQKFEKDKTYMRSVQYNKLKKKSL